MYLIFIFKSLSLIDTQSESKKLILKIDAWDLTWTSTRTNSWFELFWTSSPFNASQTHILFSKFIKYNEQSIFYLMEQDN
jgi:hypothetical protein